MFIATVSQSSLLMGKEEKFHLSSPILEVNLLVFFLLNLHTEKNDDRCFLGEELIKFLFVSNWKLVNSFHLRLIIWVIDEHSLFVVVGIVEVKDTHNVSTC